MLAIPQYSPATLHWRRVGIAAPTTMEGETVEPAATASPAVPPTTQILDSLETFDLTTDTVAAYTKRAELFFEVNNVTVDKKIPVFLNAVGKQHYQLLANVVLVATNCVSICHLLPVWHWACHFNNHPWQPVNTPSVVLHIYSFSQGKSALLAMLVVLTLLLSLFVVDMSVKVWLNEVQSWTELSSH